MKHSVRSMRKKEDGCTQVHRFKAGNTGIGKISNSLVYVRTETLRKERKTHKASTNFQITELVYTLTHSRCCIVFCHIPNKTQQTFSLGILAKTEQEIAFFLSG